MSQLLSDCNISRRRLKNLRLQTIKNLHKTLRINQSGIGQKIAFGYALAIGVAFIGSTSGVIVGDHSQKYAQDQLEIAHDQEYLLSKLDKEVLSIRSHPQRLVSVFGDSIWFDFEKNRLLGNIAEIKSLSSKLEAFIQNHPTNLVASKKEYQELLQQYALNTDAYYEWINTVWEKTSPNTLRKEDVDIAKQYLLNEWKSSTLIGVEVKFERLSEQLNRMSKHAEAQEEEAKIQLLVAQDIRIRIIIFSLLLSGIIAATLAWHTSRQIAHPIEAVTKVAQQVTQEANFTLRAPITTQDEIGVMAHSLNSLVQKVAEYTRELELGQATLEKRVDERTQELQQTLDNLRKAQSQLIQAEKMSSLGQLVAGVAHEINNPVNFIHGNLSHATLYTQDLLSLLELYQAEYPQAKPAIHQHIEDIDLEFLIEDMPRLFDSMKVGADRIREIVQSLRTFSRLDEAEVKEVNIHEGLDSTLMILHNRLKARPNHPEIQVIKNYGNLPKVECYAGQLNQVFMNILANAIDALDERTTTQPETNDTPYIAQITICTQVIATNRISIEIADNGPGMKETVRQRLFDPFFTTKPVGKGTGMGMSISYQIVTERHHGALYCTSEPGQGAKFVIEIPILQNHST